MVKQVEADGQELISGAVVFDPVRQKVGQYQAKSGPYALLRPVGGGREWEAEFAGLRPATAQERINAGLRVVNERSEQRSEARSRRLRRVFRYVPFTIAQDPTAEPEYAAQCVSGAEADCGAESGACGHPADVEDWLRAHTQETRHLRYRRTFADYAELEPPEGVSGR
ncbi:hypothetical protein ACFVW2_11140 [Streptomyces sp. NPDC058171]